MTPSEKNLFHEISIHYQPQLVQIVCDQNLKDYLREKDNVSAAGKRKLTATGGSGINWLHINPLFTELSGTGHSVLLQFKSSRIQLIILSFLFQQLLVISFLDDPPVIQYNDHIGIFHRG